MFDSTNTSENRNKIVIKLKRSVSQIKSATILNPEDNSYEENKFEICTEALNSQQESFGEMVNKKIFKPDLYCWICHFDIDLISCNNCPRQFHRKCLTIQNYEYENFSSLKWTCYECQKTALANKEKKILNSVKPEKFYEMLNNAVSRLKYSGSEPFQTSVDIDIIPEYASYVIHPIDISTMEKKIINKEYVSLEEILQDMKWIVHNCHIFNGAQSKLTSIAKSLQRMLKHEISEIEVCSDCYLNSIEKNNENWFTEACKVPHLLVYAKVRGFPYWPAKVLQAVGTEFDVRFFGAHDRSMVPLEKCYWLSKEFPTVLKNYQSNMHRSIVELRLHIKKLEEKFGEFKYADQLSLIDLQKPFVFLKNISSLKCLPIVQENIKHLRNRRTSSAHFSTNLNQNNSLIIPNSPKNEKIKEKEKRITRCNKKINSTIESTTKNELSTTTNINELELNSQDNLNDMTEQRQNELKRSTRLRKFSNKYSNFELEPLKSNLKRKSISKNLNNSVSEEVDNSKSASTPNLNTTKRIKTDSLSNSDDFNEIPIITQSPQKLDKDGTKFDLITDISEPIDNEGTSQYDFRLEEHEEEQEERIKELRRIEKFLLEEKKQIEILEKSELQQINAVDLSEEFSDEIEKNSDKQNSSESYNMPIKTKLNSPIRLKISLNNQDSKSIKSSLIKRSNSVTSVCSDQTSSLCVIKKQKLHQNETSIKINLGELVKNCKKDEINIDKTISNAEEKPHIHEDVDPNKDHKSLKMKIRISEEKEIFLKKMSNDLEKKILIQAATKNDESNTSLISSNTNKEIIITEKLERVDEINNATFIKKNSKPIDNLIVDKANIVKHPDKSENYTNILPKSTKDSESQTSEYIETKKSKILEDAQKTFEKNEKINIDEVRNTYEQLINEIKYNSELKIREILQESLKEKKKIELECEKKILLTKQKQWCANCGQESIYYCCWNTSYCDEECQKINWSKHVKTCARIGENHNQPNYSKDTDNSLNNDSQTEMNNDIQQEKIKLTSTQSDFNFTRHFQHQQQQQRVLKQKRKINPYQNYQQNQQEIISVDNPSSLLQTPNELYEAQKRIRSQQSFSKQINKL